MDLGIERVTNATKCNAAKTRARTAHRAGTTVEDDDQKGAIKE